MLIRSPKVILEHLDKYVIGQDDAKKAVALAYFLHSTRALAKQLDNKDYKKTPLLIFGATGCGKTYLLDVLCKAVNMPYTRLIAKDITLPGYVGRSIEDALKDYNSKYISTDLASQIPYGLVHIDEFDKICFVEKSNSSSTGDWRVQQQQMWLNFIEGFDYNLPSKPGMGSDQTLNTSNIMVVVTGSFAQVETYFEEKAQQEGKAIGFIDITSSDAKQTIQDKFIECGMIKELAGRFSMISKVETLGKKELKQILTAKNSIYTQYKELYSDLGLKFPKSAINKIVDEAIETKTGARGLQAAIEKRLVKELFDLDYSFCEQLNKPLEDDDAKS